MARQDGKLAARRGAKPAKGSATKRMETAAPPADVRREPRTPQREPGRQRVGAILQAASALIAEGGLSGLTIDAIVERSGTSKSSMYHFFPDLGSVVQALAERHCTNVEAHGALHAESFDWAEGTTADAVDHYLEPMRDYVRRHPDFLHVMQAAGAGAHDAAHDAGLDSLHVARAERMIAARTRGMRPAQRRARAATIFAMTVGVFEQSMRQSVTVRASMMRELRAALVAFLRSLERGGAGA